jgi:hypothetical protein
MTPDLAKLTPLVIRDWIRINLPALGVEKVADELERVSNAFAEVGAPDPTLSILVTTEMTQHLKPPPGYNAHATEQWRKLPYRLALWVRDKREQDMKAVRKCQNLEAEIIRKRKESERAV